MIVRLTEEFYCSLLDELLKFYIIKCNRIEPTSERSIFIARKYLERTRYSFDEIKTITRVKLRRIDFEFQDRLTHREKNLFVIFFERFIFHVVQVIGYINGTVKQL